MFKPSLRAIRGDFRAQSHDKALLKAACPQVSQCVQVIFLIVASLVIAF